MAALFLFATLPLPTLGTTLSLALYPEATWSKVVFALSKVWILAAPLVWLWFVEKRRPSIPRWSNRGMLAAHGSGALIFVVIAAVWYGFARERIDLPQMAGRIREAGLGHGAVYLAGAVYWCTVNSLLEECFWRWWVFERLRSFAPAVVAAVGSGVAFTVHHVVVLDVYLPWELAVLASVGVMIGGITWSAIYARFGNLWAAWVSHVWADVIIFWIGWEILRLG